MNYHYSDQKNIQIVIALLKANGIKRVITSPGATDIPINFSLQHDSFFELYSCVDERSAAYMACGMAAETGEPVALTCTGATSSRNYMPGMTEAYYRHLPVLAITCSQSSSRIGHYFNQVTDRNHLPSDIANVSVCAQIIKNPEDEWDVVNKVNKAIIALKKNGGGPAHINLEIDTDVLSFSCKELPVVRKIEHYTVEDEMPKIPEGKIAIFVGQHGVWSDELTKAVDLFCEKYNAFVIYDHISNYCGKYGVLMALIYDQVEENNSLSRTDIDLIIHIGYISNYNAKGKNVWRVNEDGEIRDTFRKLRKVYQMSELAFFNYYIKDMVIANKTMSLYDIYKSKYDDLLSKIGDLPLSNIWIARQNTKLLPNGSVLHLGIRNSLRAYSYFPMNSSISVFSNTGGFGIDGGISSLIGASMTNPNKIFFGVFGDLLFFYDMNSLGNRDIKSNLRILIINNGLGQEFKNYSCYSSEFGEEVDKFIAAKGHYGKQSKRIVKGYAESLGFEYLTASSKEDYLQVCHRFFIPQITDKPMLLEVFTNTDEENDALKSVTIISAKSKALITAKRIINAPELSGVKKTLKDILNK